MAGVGKRGIARGRCRVAGEVRGLSGPPGCRHRAYPALPPAPDRPIPRHFAGCGTDPSRGPTRANIDHIAVAPSGVWVIDAKRYKGKLAVSRPLFGKAKLMINGRDRSTLIDGLAKQVALVHEALAIHAPGVEVHGALCFIDTELPLLGTLSFGGYPLLRAKALAKQLNTTGDIDGEHARTLATIINERFPAA